MHQVNAGSDRELDPIGCIASSIVGRDRDENNIISLATIQGTLIAKGYLM